MCFSSVALVRMEKRCEALMSAPWCNRGPLRDDGDGALTTNPCTCTLMSWRRSRFRTTTNQPSYCKVGNSFRSYTMEYFSLKRSTAADRGQANISSKVYVRSTKSGKVQKIVRELYLRQDIPCSSNLCRACLEIAPTDYSKKGISLASH